MVCLTLIVSEFTLTHVDEVIDELLKKDYSCDIALPRIKKRYPFFFFLLYSLITLVSCVVFCVWRPSYAYSCNFFLFFLLA